MPGLGHHDRAFAQVVHGYAVLQQVQLGQKGLVIEEMRLAQHLQGARVGHLDLAGGLLRRVGSTVVSQ